MFQLLAAVFHEHVPLCQDPHLNRFFQQCQKRELDLSQPPTSNFLNCLKVRGKSAQSVIYRVVADRNLFFSLFFIYFYYLANLFHSFLQIHLKGLLSMERIPVIVRFLPVLFNQLFKVLTQNDNDEVTTATTR